MRVLLFTHQNDIDGIGCAVLAHLAFKNLKIITCETFDINKNFKTYLESKEIYDYDQIYVTDLCIKEPILSLINTDDILKNKVKVLDHHKSEIDEGNNKYDFVNIIVENDLGKCCGTSLFYDELINNNYINKTNIIDYFVELTRLHDTWEWITKYNNPLARDLSILFDLLGIDKYIEVMTLKLKNDTNFEFDEKEKYLIDIKKEIIIKKVNMYYKTIVIRVINGLKAGIVFIDYEYRNELGEYVKHANIDIDFIMMVSLDKSYISYRGVNPKVDVSQIAKLYGGKGHFSTGANPIENSKINDIIDLIIRKD